MRKNVDELMREELKNLKMVGWLCYQIIFISFHCQSFSLKLFYYIGGR